MIGVSHSLEKNSQFLIFPGSAVFGIRIFDMLVEKILKNLCPLAEIYEALLSFWHFVVVWL